MTQHECSRLGCTRLTSEQECDLHAAEPAGVVHQAKDPRMHGGRCKGEPLTVACEHEAKEPRPGSTREARRVRPRREAEVSEAEECPCRAYDDDPNEDDTCFCGHHIDEHESLAEARSFSAECLVGRKRSEP